MKMGPNRTAIHKLAREFAHQLEQKTGRSWRRYHRVIVNSLINELVESVPCKAEMKRRLGWWRTELEAVVKRNDSSEKK